MKNLLLILLTASLILSSFVSCAETADDKTGTEATADPTENPTAENVSEESEPGKYDYAREKYNAISAADFEGADFGIVSQVGVGSCENEIWVEELTGDGINDAVFNRNLSIAETFNCNIALTPGDVTQLVRKSVQAADGSYKLAFPSISSATSIAQSGMLMNFNKMDNLNLNETWWDQGTLEMDILGQVYFMNGDINYLDNDVTYIQLFNKQLITDLNLEVPYELVREGKWTIDVFRTMCLNVTSDLDGDGAYTDNDRYGYVATGAAPTTFFYSSGLTAVKTDSEGIPFLDVDMEKTVSALEKVIKIISEDHITRIPSDFSVGKEIFMDDRALFYGEVLSYVFGLREMETAFGILPIPKYDEEQEEHYTYCAGNASTVCIPKASENVGMITSVLEGMAIQSYIQVTPAYYDIALYRKYIRDNDSTEMLDIALKNRVYDIDFYYNIGIGKSFTDLAASNSTNFASTFEKRQTSGTKILERLVKSFEKLSD